MTPASCPARGLHICISIIYCSAPDYPEHHAYEAGACVQRVCDHTDCSSEVDRFASIPAQLDYSTLSGYALALPGQDIV